MKTDFRPLRNDAILLLSAATGIDFSQSEFSNESEWFCCTVRDDDDRVALVVVFEFKTPFDAHLSTVLVDTRALNRRLLTALTRTVFTKATRVTAMVDPQNVRALRQVWRMGFKHEGYIRRGIEGTRDGVMFGLLPEDCPYLEGKPFRFQFVDMSMAHPEQPGVH
jgi:ribosomal protein S18 acetylase RimI-like enzyme